MTLLLQELRTNVKSTHVKLTKLRVCQPGQVKRKPIEQILARMVDFVVAPASFLSKTGFLQALQIYHQNHPFIILDE